ncbi:peptidoglycan-binding protein LysM domain protein, CBM50 domain protein [Polaribacter sp. Hel1_85]|nr:peptidoglycan-binding protein LysM domain protein, CBM50 domain protein [Polaribacter sp. Hel1_85]
MKKFICLAIILSSLSTFSQKNNSAAEFDEIVLDGKKAYMNIKTGEIVTDISKKASNSESEHNNLAILNSNNSLIHSVKKGETLSSISRTYGITMSQLKDLNANINFNNIKINQIILINNINKKIDEVASNEYVVKKEDTLYYISKMFKISVSDLKRINNLDSNLISIGQKIRFK